MLDRVIGLARAPQQSPGATNCRPWHRKCALQEREDGAGEPRPPAARLSPSQVRAALDPAACACVVRSYLAVLALRYHHPPPANPCERSQSSVVAASGLEFVGRAHVTILSPQAQMHLGLRRPPKSLQASGARRNPSRPQARARRPSRRLSPRLVGEGEVNRHMLESLGTTTPCPLHSFAQRPDRHRFAAFLLGPTPVLPLTTYSLPYYSIENIFQHYPYTQ